MLSLIVEPPYAVVPSVVRVESSRLFMGAACNKIRGNRSEPTSGALEEEDARDAPPVSDLKQLKEEHRNLNKLTMACNRKSGYYESPLCPLTRTFVVCHPRGVLVGYRCSLSASIADDAQVRGTV